jgi:hypothetical protein
MASLYIPFASSTHKKGGSLKVNTFAGILFNFPWQSAAQGVVFFFCVLIDPERPLSRTRWMNSFKTRLSSSLFARE